MAVPFCYAYPFFELAGGNLSLAFYIASIHRRALHYPLVNKVDST